MNDNVQIITDKTDKLSVDKRYSSVVMASVLGELEALLIGKETPVDYMVFKELSELVDMTRLQAMQDIALMRIQSSKKGHSTPFNLKSTWALYRRANNLYFTVYNQEIKRCHDRRYRPNLKAA